MVVVVSCYGLRWSLPYGDHWLAGSVGSVSDVAVSWARLPAVAASREQAATEASADHYAVRWDGWLAATVDDGQRVQLEVAAECDSAAIGTYLWGPLAAVVLAQRGILALHANALWTPSGAVLIVGAAGMGKSTLSAALVQAGWPLISDDVVAINGVACWNGPPRSKLWPSAVRALGLPAQDLHPLHPGYDKQGWRCSALNGRGPWPIAQILVLTEDETVQAPQISEHQTQAAWTSLLAHGLAAQVTGRFDQKGQLSAITHLASAVPVRQVVLPPIEARDVRAVAAWLRGAL